MQAAFLQPDETAFDVMKRSGYNPTTTNTLRFDIADLDSLLASHVNVNSPVVYEIEGEAGTGKTFMLMKLVQHVISVQNGDVLYFNLDKRLNPHRFNPTTTSQQGEVYIVSPNDCYEFLVLLHKLTAQHKFRLVVIDSLLTLFEFSAMTDPLASGFPVSIPRVLFELAKRYGFAIAAAKPKMKDEICSKTWTQSLSLCITLNHQSWGELWDAKRNIELGRFNFIIDM